MRKTEEQRDREEYCAYVDSGFTAGDMTRVRRHQRRMAEQSTDRSAGPRFDEQLARALRSDADAEHELEGRVS